MHGRKSYKVYGLRELITWLFHMITCWCSQLILQAKVFIWRVMVEALPLGYALNKRNIALCTCGDQNAASFPNHFWALAIFGDIVQLGYANCLHICFAGWGGERCCKLEGQMTMLDKSRNLNHEESILIKVTCHYIHHLNWCVSWDWVHSIRSLEL